MVWSARFAVAGPAPIDRARPSRNDRVAARKQCQETKRVRWHVGPEQDLDAVQDGLVPKELLGHHPSIGMIDGHEATDVKRIEPGPHGDCGKCFARVFADRQPESACLCTQFLPDVIDSCHVVTQTLPVGDSAMFGATVGQREDGTLESIHDLLGQIRKSEIVLPEFQRGYVWNRDQVRLFVQSLYKGRPTGHFLIWKTYKPSKIRGETTPGDGHTLLLLDGQQRLTSLYTLFEGKPPPFYEGEDLFFNLYFNVVTEEFRFWQKTIMEGDPSWISVHGFLSEGIASFIKALPSIEQPARDVYTEHLDRLAKLHGIRDYHFQLDTLADESLTVDEVVEIFNRVNSAGTPLTKADLAIAHICSVWPEAREQFREFSAEMHKHGFGVDLNFLVRSVAALASGSVLLEGTFYKVPVEDLQLAWKQVRQAFEHLVNVLRHEAFVDRKNHLGTDYALVPPTVYLASHGGVFTDDRTKAQFIRWIFLASIWSRYSGSTETKLQRDIALVLEQEDPVVALIDGILDERGRIQLEAKDLEGKGAGSSVYKFSYVVARARAARDWFTGQILYNKAIGAANGLESHHIFPTAYLKKNGYNPSKDRRHNEVANRAFLTQKANRKISASAPSGYLPAVQLEFPGALQAQSVTMNQDLWAFENFELFLAERRKLLANAMNQYLDSLVPPEIRSSERSEELSRYLEQEESAELEFKGSMRYDQHTKQVNPDLERAIAKSVAGFLNSKKGGVLLIGIQDHTGPDGLKEVFGLAKDYSTLGKDADRDGFELKLTTVITNHLGPAVAAFITITFHQFDGNDVCQVTVEPSDHPMYCHEGGDNYTFFLRVGNSTKPLPLPEVGKYVATRWG